MFVSIVAAMACVVLGWRGTGATRRQVAGVLLAFALLLTLLLSGCGGGAAKNPGTAAGSYALTVTGTAGSGSAALSHSITLTPDVSRSKRIRGPLRVAPACRRF